MKISDHFERKEDFENLLTEAAEKCRNLWEENFVEDIRERLHEFGDEMFISKKQVETLERIRDQ